MKWTRGLAIVVAAMALATCAPGESSEGERLHAEWTSRVKAYDAALAAYFEDPGPAVSDDELGQFARERVDELRKAHDRWAATATKLLKTGKLNERQAKALVEFRSASAEFVSEHETLISRMDECSLDPYCVVAVSEGARVRLAQVTERLKSARASAQKTFE